MRGTITAILGLVAGGFLAGMWANGHITGGPASNRSHKVADPPRALTYAEVYLRAARAFPGGRVEEHNDGLCVTLPSGSEVEVLPGIESSGWRLSGGTASDREKVAVALFR